MPSLMCCCCGGDYDDYDCTNTSVYHTTAAVAVSCTDHIYISVMVFTGATLGLFFSYYRHPPLLISIKWLTLTLILNSFLLAILWNERVEAEELGNDPEQVTGVIYHFEACL